MNGGWIKLWRKTLESDMYRSLNSKQKEVMFVCLMLANHKEKEWVWGNKPFSLQKGQFITSLETLDQLTSKELTKQNIRTALKKLKTWGFLTDESTKTGRLITVVNWDIYQGEEEATNKDSNKDLTKSQQRPNKQTNTYQEEKNVKNEKNDKKNKPPIIPLAEFVSMTQAEYDKLLAEYGPQKTKRMIEILDNYKGANGKTYKSDYRAILHWVVKRAEEEDKQRKGPGMDNEQAMKELLAELEQEEANGH